MGKVLYSSSPEEALPTKDTKVSKVRDLTQEDILAECSHNVNLLFNLLDNVNKGESFVKQKKSRDIRCKDIFFVERINKFVNKALSWSGTTAFRFFFYGLRLFSPRIFSNDQ